MNKKHASGEVSRVALLDSDFQGRVRLAVVKAALTNMRSTNPQVVVYSMKVLNGDVNNLLVSIAVAAESEWSSPTAEPGKGKPVDDAVPVEIDDATLLELVSKPSDPENSVFYKLAMADAFKNSEQYNHAG